MDSQHATIRRITFRAELLFAAALLASAGTAGAAEKAVPFPVTDARTCAALAVYGMGAEPEWDARAERALEVLSKADAAGQLPDCRIGLQRAMAHDFSPAQWRVSLALVDAAREALSQAQISGRCVAVGAAL